MTIKAGGASASSVTLSTLGGLPGGILSASSQTAAFTLTLPAKGFILGIMVRERAGNAITGGLKCGTTSGDVDVVAAKAVGGSSIGHVFDAALLKRIFSMSATQDLFFDAVAAWNSASIDVQVPYVLLS